jgi:hypothetical protein
VQYFSRHPAREDCTVIRFQIVEQRGADLYRTLVQAMREGDLHTFYVTKRGRRVQHKNPSYTGWMNWLPMDGIIHCEVLSPRKPGAEWRLFSAFMGRLADRYASHIAAVNVQFPDATPLPPPKRRKRR